MIKHIFENGDFEAIAVALSFSMKRQVVSSQISEVNPCIMSGEIDVELSGENWSDYNEVGDDILYFGTFDFTADSGCGIDVMLGSKKIKNDGISQNHFSFMNPFLFSNVIFLSNGASVGYQFVGFQIRLENTGVALMNNNAAYTSPTS